MVKSVSSVKKHEAQVEKGEFLVVVAHSDAGWVLGIEKEGRTLFSATGDTREAVLKRLDDFIAELIELSRYVELAMKKMEEIEESMKKE